MQTESESRRRWDPVSFEERDSWRGDVAGVRVDEWNPDGCLLNKGGPVSFGSSARVAMPPRV